MAWQLDKIANGVSEAASDPSRWPAAMDLAAEETSSHGAILLPLQGQPPIVPMSQSVLPIFERFLAEGWVDERQKAYPKVVARGWGTDLDVMSPAEMRRSAWYQEFLAPMQLQWCAMIRINAGEDIWGLAIQRTFEQGPVQPADLKKLSQLMAPLSAAATLARALGFARAEGALNAFEVSDTAALMLSSSGEILRMNRRAHELIGEDILIAHRRLRSSSKAASDILNKSIFQVLSTTDWPVAPAIALPRQFGKPIIANILRADLVSMDVLSPARAFVLLTDTERDSAPTLLDLKNIFGLTNAEGRLVLELQKGRSLIEAASRLNTTYETARTTLKQAFRKTGTSGQPDLLRLISKVRKETKLQK